MSHIRTTPLTDAELDHYRTEGWVKLGRVLDDATLEAIRAEEARFRGDPGGQHTIFRSQVLHYSEPIRRYVTDGPQVPLAAQLVGAPNVAIWFTQFVTKLNDGATGKSEFPWHQDNGYAAVEPATNVTIWVALDDVDEQNGCVWVMPRSHVKGLLDHKTKSADSWHLTLPVEGDGVPAIMKAGEAVAFTGLTLHRSKLNHTPNARRAFFMEYADATATFQRPGTEERPMLSESNTWVVTGQAPWPGA
jgi:phytanoyl-CoA hydroxylase